MYDVMVPWMVWPALLFAASGQAEPSLSTLLENYAANQDKAHSWIVRYDISQSHFRDGQLDQTHQESGQVHFDGQRVLLHSCTTFFSPKQASAPGEPNSIGPPREATLLWDGKQHVNYTQTPGKGPATARINPHETPFEIEYVQHINNTGFLFGYLDSSFLRLDDLLRQARRGEARISRQVVAGAEYSVIEADTAYGRLTVWLDPSHGYNMAKLTVRQTGKDGHMVFDRPLASGIEQSLDLEYQRFERFADMWLPVEAKWVQETINKGKRDRYCLDLRVTGFVPNPDPNTLGPFTLDFIPEGATVWLFPSIQIQYTWHNGKPVPQYEQGLVRQLDRVLDEMTKAPPLGPLAAEASDEAAPLPGMDAWPLLFGTVGSGPLSLGTGELTVTPVASVAEANAPTSSSGGPHSRRTHCGLYCIYSMLRLTGQKVDFEDLVKPEYLGSFDGSSLSDLIRAAMNNGLYAAGAARLTPRILSQSPCPVILHVRGDPDSPKYDHYELFLGTEDGKAKMLNPPLAPQLVGFGELAARWDGMGLIVSGQAPDVEGLFAAQRQRLLLAAGIAAVGIVLMHGLGRVWSARVGALPRRWGVVLSVGQGSLLGLAALPCGVSSNLTDTEGLLATAEGVRSVRQAHLGGFLPTVDVRQVKRLLDTDTMFVDARLSPDYQAGHLKGAVSVPVDANDSQRHAATGDLNRNRRVVVYGQSKGCHFAQTVAVRLLDDGFRDVWVFKGGWREWTAKNGTPIAKEAAKANGTARGQG